MNILHDGNEIAPSGPAPDYSTEYAIVPVARLPEPAAAFPLYLQWQDEGVDLGDRNVRVVNIVTSPAFSVSRGTGEKANVITIAQVNIPPVLFVCSRGPVWAATVIPNAESLNCMAYGNGLFVAGGIIQSAAHPCAVWSGDGGVTWNESSTAFGSESGYGFRPLSMAYGNGVWLAGMNAIDGWKSTDGKTWTKIGNPHILVQGAYGGVSNFVFMSSFVSATCYTTTSGTFTARTLPASGSWTVVGSNGSGKFIVARGDSSADTAVSNNDGVTWSASGALPFITCSTIAYGNGVWVAVPFATDTRVAYSIDGGASWHYSNTVYAPGTVWRRVRFLQGMFLLTDVGGTHNFNSADGITWSATGSNVSMPSYFIDWDGDNLGNYAAIGVGGSDTTVANYGICRP